MLADSLRRHPRALGEITQPQSLGLQEAKDTVVRGAHVLETGRVNPLPRLGPDAVQDVFEQLADHEGQRRFGRSRSVT